MKIAERFRGQRLGEGAIGLVLWKWQKSGTDEIYVTAFDKQDLLISQLEKFGFHKAGLTIIKFSISKASLTKNPIPNTGRTISGKDSDEVIQQFGASLT